MSSLKNKKSFTDIHGKKGLIKVTEEEKESVSGWNDGIVLRPGQGCFVIRDKSTNEILFYGSYSAAEAYLLNRPDGLNVSVRYKYEPLRNGRRVCMHGAFSGVMRLNRLANGGS